MFDLFLATITKVINQYQCNIVVDTRKGDGAIAPHPPELNRVFFKMMIY